MKILRRTVIKLSLGVTAAGAIAGLGWRYSRRGLLPLSERERGVLSVLVDFLVPADDASPGAVELGVDRAILDSVDDDRRLRGRIRHGLNRLDEISERQLGNSFDNLARIQQSQMIQLIADAPRGTVEQAFFRRLHKLTLNLYYSHPQSWISLGYSGPPQPLGFMDYADPPAIEIDDVS